MAVAALEPILIKDAKHRDYVDDAAYYYAVVQFGSGISWRGLPSGKWVQSPDDNRPGQTAYRHKAGIGRAGPISGKVVNGLVTLHNRFLDRNRERLHNLGEINKMFLVVDIEQTHDVPADAADGGSPFAKALIAAAQAAVRESIKMLREEEVALQPRRGRPPKQD